MKNADAGYDMARCRMVFSIMVGVEDKRELRFTGKRIATRIRRTSLPRTIVVSICSI